MMYGSEDKEWRSATGRFIARWKVNLRVKPGGAGGIGVASNPPAGVEEDDDAVRVDIGAEVGLPSAAAPPSAGAEGLRIFLRSLK